MATARSLKLRTSLRRALGGAVFVATLVGPRGREAPLAATSPVVARVGTHTITVADLERRIASIPPFQLKAFGSTPDEVRKEFLERVLIREELLSQAAEDRHLEQREDVRDRLRGVLRTVLLNHLRADVVLKTHIEDADVKAYYDKNISKFHTPERYSVWMIATRKQEEAKEIIEDLKKDASPKHWTELTRLRSIDGASASRGGNVGFVQPDGTTQEPGVKLSPVLMEAVKRLSNTEISPTPVKDQDRWVILWRKETMAAVTRPLDVEAGSIRQMLMHMRVDARTKETIAALRKEYLGEHNPDLIDLFDITPQGDVTPVRRPGSLPQSRRMPAIPTPSPGLR